MDQNEIIKILPHRENMLLLEEVHEENGTAIGSYRIRGDEWFLQGHFPGNPIVPGVIQCEMLAQTTCILLRDKMKPGMLPLYTGLNNVRFRAPVRPGDVFRTECRIVRVKLPFYFAEGKGTVNGTLCVKAEFSFSLTEDKNVF